MQVTRALEASGVAQEAPQAYNLQGRLDRGQNNLNKKP
jgi:hypothetical protein